MGDDHRIGWTRRLGRLGKSATNRIARLRSGTHRLSRTLRYKIILYFLPLLLLSASLSASAVYIVLSRGFRQNTETMLRVTVNRSADYLSAQLYTALDRIVQLENSREFSRVILDYARGEVQNREASRMAELSNKTETVLQDHYDLLQGVIVSIKEGDFFLHTTEEIAGDIDLKFSELAGLFPHQPSQYYWIPGYRNRFVTYNNQDEPPALLVRLIGREDSLVNGILAFAIRTDVFSQALASSEMARSAYLGVISNTRTIYQKSPQLRMDGLEHSLVQKLSQGEPGLATYSFRDPERGRLTVVSRDVIPSGWRVYAAIPQSEILSGARSLGVFLVVTVVSTTLIGALLYSFVAKIVTDPLRQLTEKMEAIPSRHEDVEFNIRSNDEIGRLNDGIAGLVSRMIALMDRISAEEEAKRDAQISALTAQIKPHFLYNTLNTVKHLYGLGEAERASTMLSALSDYFRYTMEEWKTPATVGREVEHAESFLLIARTRLGDPVEYYIDVDIDIINEPVMRITLQPLVENALKHGTPEPPQKTRIGILGKRDTTRQSIVLSVLDNGPGVPQPSLRRLNGATDGTDTHEFGVGLANLRERLSAYYSSRASLEVINRSAGGTEVRITTPINISKRDG